jgi:uncharacterized protein YjbI with pentapeptide repeats
MLHDAHLEKAALRDANLEEAWLFNAKLFRLQSNSPRRHDMLNDHPSRAFRKFMTS